MPGSRPPIVRSVAPTEILGLFLRGLDTVDIAQRFGIKEHEAYKLLRFAMETRRAFHDKVRDPIPHIDEPPVEGH